MKENTTSGVSGFWYLLGGLAVGAAAGVLLAPKSGAETREDIEGWGKRSGEKAQSLIARVGNAIPFRVKAAAAVGAVKGGAKEAVNAAHDGIRNFNAA
jgi:gas vesicle protein